MKINSSQKKTKTNKNKKQHIHSNQVFIVIVSSNMLKVLVLLFNCIAGVNEFHSTIVVLIWIHIY